MNDDNIKFKEDVLKDIKNFQENLIAKINVKFTDLNNDYKKLNEELKTISKQNKQLIDTIISQNVSLEKLSTLEQFRNKVDSILITHEIRINNNIDEIAYMRNKYDKAISENLLVPGYVGPACQYKNLGEYILSSLGEFSKMKSEKEIIRNSFKDLRIKTDTSMRTILNINESLVRRCNEYTDTKIFEYKRFIIDKVNFIKEKEKEIKEIAEYFKQEQEIYIKNKKQFEKELNERIFTLVNDKINESISNQESIINKVIIQNKNTYEIYEIQIKEIKDEIKEIQNNIQNMKSDIDISMIKHLVQDKHNRNSISFAGVSPFSQKAMSFFRMEKKEEKITQNNEINENNKINEKSEISEKNEINEKNETKEKNEINENNESKEVQRINTEFNENYRPIKTFSSFYNSNVIKKDESSKQNDMSKNDKLNSESKIISQKVSQKSMLKSIINDQDKKHNENHKNNNYVEKSVESAPIIYKEKEQSDILIKPRNSKILILNYGQKNNFSNSIRKTKINMKKSITNNSNRNEFMKNLGSIRALNLDNNNFHNFNFNVNKENKENKETEANQYSIKVEEKSSRNLIDELQNPKILERRILTNEDIKMNQDKNNSLKLKMIINENLSRSGSDLNRLIVKNLSPKVKIYSFKTLDNLKKNSTNWKSEKNIVYSKDRVNKYNMVQLELRSENNITNGAKVIANKKIMNQHITKLEKINSLEGLYNIKLLNKNSEKIK